VAPGEPRHDDDGWDDKLAIVLDARVAVVSFTLGCQPADVVAALQRSARRCG
jgi:nitronate monooxygenase